MKYIYVPKIKYVVNIRYKSEKTITNNHGPGPNEQYRKTEKSFWTHNIDTY